MCKQKIRMLRFLCIVITACICCNVTAQQNATLTGSVTDSSNNSAIPNVSVTLKGSTTTGTVTDANGNFSITVPRGSVLTFSSVNYATREIKTGNDLSLNVVLAPSSSELNEVVVIGYGTRKRKDVTGSIATVDAKDITKSTAMTPELALQG